MANRRMFSKTITESDAFLDMPLSAQALYFHLGMYADDDGFINNTRNIQAIIGASAEDLRLLFEKRFLLRFDSGVSVIKHWWINNQLRKDRYTPTAYQDEYKELSLKSNNAYTLTATTVAEDGKPNGNQMATKWQPNGTERLPKDSIGKDSKDKKSTPPIVPPTGGKGQKKDGKSSQPQTQIEFPFTGILGEAVKEWLEYKKEKRQGYKPAGVKALFTQIGNKAKEFGDIAVADVIRESMANGYQGIVFDRIGRGKPQTGGRTDDGFERRDF